MKTVFAILALLSSIQVFGQETINQLTKKGQKTGKWLEHNDDGNISEIRFYEPSFLLTNHEEFVYETWDGVSDTLHYADTVGYSETLLWTEKYEYNSQKEFVKVVRFIRGEDPVYLYGPNKEISITKDQFSFHERVSDIESITIKITNQSEKLLSLTASFQDDNLSIEQNTCTIPPHESSSFTFHITIEKGVNSYIASLHNDSISVDITVNTKGYHLKSSDLSPQNQFSFSHEFIYWRSDNEALLRVYDSKQEKILRTFSLAHEKTVIDLDEITPGDYFLCKKDFSIDQETCCKLKLEK